MAEVTTRLAAGAVFTVIEALAVQPAAVVHVALYTFVGLAGLTVTTLPV
ncbi:hypothetical protein GCM10028807_00280 [Spirosoma daeguense]